ncbi:helix-turn-helix domain-containing protein [Microbacterium sp.]|uniref:helix-turn-helix domain-containing protein n=1 Tax=Microbacterium sp. TaxID=51671 RepID=UPI0039E6E4FE
MSSTALIQTGTRIPQFDVHDRARKARVSAGMEQQDLCDATGISMTSISKIETGKVAPRKTTLMLWALATGVSYEWLATGKDNESNDPGRVTQR